MRREIDLESIAEVAKALKELKDPIVFVGGAVVSLYIDDPAADEPRPTKDIDIVLNIVTLGKLEAIRQFLVSRGFSQDPEEKVICRFVYQDILVDVMSIRKIDWAPANRWFEEGFHHREAISISDNITINIFSLPYFLASKFETFRVRGTDPRTSHDFEDIIYILDNRTDAVLEIRKAPDKVLRYLKSELGDLLQPNMEEAVLCHLNPITSNERYPLLIRKIEEILL